MCTQYLWVLVNSKFKQWQRWCDVIPLIRSCYMAKITSMIISYYVRLCHQTPGRLSLLVWQCKQLCWRSTLEQELCASFRTWGQSPASSQQKAWNFGYIATTTWILTIWTLKYIFPQLFLQMRVQLSCPRSLIHRKYDVMNVCCLKLLSSW